MKGSKDPKRTSTSKGRSSSTGPRGNRQQYRENSGSKDNGTKFSPTTKHNDPAWYSSNDQLVKDIASISFNNALGSPFTLTSSFRNLTAYTGVLPGIMSIYNAPAPGVATGARTPSAPINVAARNIYSFVRHANSGSKNYDAPDLMLYLLAMDSIYTFHAWMVRLYGMLNAFSRINRYVGDALLQANNVNPGDLRSNFANFRSYINQFAIKASAMCVPDTMSYFIRHRWMYSSYYSDENVNKAQYYMYVPAFLYAYNNGSGEGPGFLESMPLTTRTGSNVIETVDPLGYADIAGYGNYILESVLKEEDLNIMSGDILKAYGPDKMVRLNMITEEYAVGPTFSEEVLAQIHNSDFMGITPMYAATPEDPNRLSFATFNITQAAAVGSGYLIYKPYCTQASHLTYDKLLDHWKESVTPEDVLVMSRNCLSATRSGNLIYLSSCGADLCLFAKTYYYGATSGSLLDATHYAGDTHALINATVGLFKFNEYPVAYIINDGRTALESIVGEISNYAIVSQQNIEDMHNCALLNMFGVPYIKG